MRLSAALAGRLEAVAGSPIYLSLQYDIRRQFEDHSTELEWHLG
jgi:hypothetical protein